MFDFSFPELLIIGLVAVLVLDPRHLPGLARSAGRWMGRARRFVDKMRADLDDQIGAEHLAPLRELNEEWQRAKSSLKGPIPAEWLADEVEGQNETEEAVTPVVSPAPTSTPRPKRRSGGRRSRVRHPASANRTKPTARKPNGGGEAS